MESWSPRAGSLFCWCCTGGGVYRGLHRRFAAPPFASLRSAPVPPLNVPRVAVVQTPIDPTTRSTSHHNSPPIPNPPRVAVVQTSIDSARLVTRNAVNISYLQI